MNTIELKLSLDEIHKHGLSLLEYLLLGYMVEVNFNELNFNPEDLQLEFVLSSLSLKGFIRVIDGIVIINDKGRKLFIGEYTKDAKELLDYFNQMKSEHLSINRPTKAAKYVVKFKALLSAGHNIEYIKEVLEYCFSTWKNDDFWKNHLNVETLCRHFDKYADKYEISKGTETSINRML